MERAIELCTDRATLGDLYAELANETSYRAGMWRQRPDIDVVDGWISRALEHAAPDSAAPARALLSPVFWNPEGGREAAREAVEIAERLDDPELRSYAYDAQAITLLVRGNLGDAYKLELRRFEFLDRITDPEHVGDIYYAPITASVSFGRFDEARELAQKHEEICAPLTPHHRTHGSAVLIELEELAGRWDNVRALQPLVEARAVDNAETRCVRDARSLLVCALAHTFAGNEDEARRLEEAAEAMRIEGFGHVLDTPRLELALARGDLGRAEQLVEKPPPDRGWHRGWLLLASQTVRLDALAALGRADALEAWPAVEPGTYVEPFLLRARGLVHGDAALVDRAVAGFEALGLHWHAGGTRVSV